MKIALVGATGLVGTKMLQVLEERNFPVTELLPVASARSVGKMIRFKGTEYPILSMQDAVDQRPDIAIFSAGGSVSLEWAPKFAANDTVVIDNSSAWRMDPDKKLVVPEVNAHVLTADDKIIANPNCSTIQMVVALKPLHDTYKIRRVVVSTYQSVTGTGVKAVNQLMDERAGKPADKAYAYPIDMNLLPHVDIFLENGYTKEEMKMVLETKKILDENIQLTATAVRVPVIGGHSEAVNVEFENEFDLKDVVEKLRNFPGITIVDDVSKLEYPMPITAHDKDDVFVGRIRRDETQEKTLNLWIVSDNLRKGAATNAIQIAEYLVESGIIKSA
jgi:aspartate-semialdehyde dehydrogenase